MLVASIVGVLVTLLDIPVNFLFELLASPTTTMSNELKNSAAWGGRQAVAVVQTARRASTVSAGAIRRLASVAPVGGGAAAGPSAARRRSTFAFIHDEATYRIGPDVLVKRNSIVGSVSGDQQIRTHAGSADVPAPPTAAAAILTLSLRRGGPRRAVRS